MADVAQGPALRSEPDRRAARREAALPTRWLAVLAGVAAMAAAVLSGAAWHMFATGAPPGSAVQTPAASPTARPPAAASPLGGPAVHDALTDRVQPPSEPPPAS